MLPLQLLKLCRSRSSGYEMALSYFVMRTVMLEEEEKKQKLSRRRRILRERFAMNSIPDKEFIYKYRLSRELFDKLCAEVTPLLPPKQRQNELDPSIKVLAVLNFYAWGRLQHSTGKHFGLLANHTMSRCIREVTDALTHSTITRKYIKFPRTKEERDVIKKKFFEKFGFPDVIGCIDFNHIAISKPAKNEEYYLNEHNYYSFLAQIICDADCNILSLNANAGGASDCTDIWFDDPISDHLNILEDTAYLIGNANCNLEDHLMIPIPVEDVTENSPESRYNDLHKSVYTTIDQTIYKLKSRWRCLLTRKELNYDHAMAARIVLACCVLLNMCNTAGLEAPEMSERDIEEERKRQNDISEVSYYGDFEEYRVKLVQVLEENRLKACSETMEVTCGNTEVACSDSMEATCSTAPYSNTTEVISGNSMEATCTNAMEAKCTNTTNAMSGNATEAMSGNATEAMSGNATEAMSGNATEATCSNTTEAKCSNTMEAKCSNTMEAK